ncbi:MAG: TIGR03032 family protein [Bacteroidetes bacterium]|nr:TIGR03032 family protein [Bacteroidota bacterium]
MKNPLPPFSSTYSPNVPELLNTLNISLALSTYQAGKLIFLSAKNQEELIQLPRTFDNIMGIAVKDKMMAIACKNELVELLNTSELAPTYPKKPNIYDALYLPRATYYTGQLALHDMEFTDDGILAVNTLFSCLSIINNECSFKPVWNPKFIKELTPNDNCHLNGMALKDGKPVYVSALGKTNTRQGWRDNKMTGGVLIDVNSNEIILENLQMPHSPRIYNDKLYFLNSAAGELCAVDTDKRTYGTITKLGSYARGMDRCGDYLFIGVSKLRHKSSVFGDLPIAKSSFAGILIVYLPMGNIVGHIRYETSVEEIYDVKVLPGLRRPGIVSHTQDVNKLALTSPIGDFWAAEEK